MACDWCPRGCGADRAGGELGVCGAPAEMRVARAALHFWEEPPLSGERGSGAVFFTHCPLRCAYCQNAAIAHGAAGRVVTVDDVAAMMCSLARQGALNINCVTPTHYAPGVREAVRRARAAGMDLPVVWNTSGYETVSAVQDNAGVVDVYLTDFKYASASLARAYSQAPDYPRVALAALDAMVDVVGDAVYDDVDGQPRMLRGIVVRHLLLPGAVEDSLAVVRLLHERYGPRVRLSLMNQYTPVLAQAAAAGDERALRVLERFPELGRRVPDADYERVLDFADDLGVEDYFWQDGPAAEESFIPPFDLTGVEPADAGAPGF